MTILVVGATGATGKLLVEQLLDRGHHVKMIVRNPDKMPEKVRNHKNAFIIQAALLDLTDEEMTQYVAGCQVVVSCLGHNVSFKGIYGSPHRLVTDAVRRLSQAVRANDPKERVKFILMNTTGNSNRDLKEKVSVGQHIVLGLLRLLLPPHVDNEKAADYLRLKIGQNNKLIEWTAVRPDGLIDEAEVSDYEIYPSPIRSAIFNPGQTSRINVAHFMAELVEKDDLWNQWKGKMPVIYNKESLLK